MVVCLREPSYACEIIITITSSTNYIIIMASTAEILCSTHLVPLFAEGGVLLHPLHLIQVVLVLAAQLCMGGYACRCMEPGSDVGRRHNKSLGEFMF